MSETTAELPILASPSTPPHPLVDTPAAYQQMVESLAGGHGPLAIDAERAHGYRYFMWAYLLQFRRAGAGTYLLDPIALANGKPPAQLTELADAISNLEWILHAATQDLPCLADNALLPTKLFDTELAARILGWPKVALSTLVAQICRKRLLKQHQAADWSTRPLPESWLTYAALDVELLDVLRSHLIAELTKTNRMTWAEQEFAWLASTAGQPKTVKPEPWRRLSQISQVRSPTGLAIARELWCARDSIAQRLDKPPGRILTDQAITELAAQPHPRMETIGGFAHRNAKRYAANWRDAIARAQQTPQAELPSRYPRNNAMPHPRGWQRRHPEAYARFVALRKVVNNRAGELQLPAEVLVQPDAWHRLCWNPPAQPSPTTVDRALADGHARPWQRELLAAQLAAALAGH